jgi:signal transduction histidine kinase
VERWRTVADRWRDPVVAVVLSAGAVVDVLLDPPSVVPAAVLSVVTLGVTLPLAVRRRFPLAVPLLVIACFAATSALDDTGSTRVAPVIGAVLALWTLGRHCGWPRLAVGLTWFVAALVTAQVLHAGHYRTTPEDVLFGLLLYVLPVAAGNAVRLREAHVELVTEQAARAEADRDRALSEAVDAERDRIARELHDIVMHSISVIAVQTQAIGRRLGPGHERDAEDLRAVERTAREAMTEMRRLFGVLRAGDGPPQLAPQPGLAQLDRLLADARRAGLRIDADVQLPERPLTAGVDLTAYRLLQESLTNVLKHAGPDASVRVVVAGQPGELTLEVCDDGPGHARPVPGGHGLIGMRERVSVYGGTLQAGPGPGGGFRVAARLPTSEAVVP